MSFFVWAIIISIISLLLYVVSFMFYGEENVKDSSSSFECGIEPLSSLKGPFYMHFFYVSILFLVFDIELILTVPLIFLHTEEMMMNLFWASFTFLLFIGLVVEVNLGTLEWWE